MNGKELLEAMSFIDDGLLAESEFPVKKTSRKRWTALAACLCILLLGTLSYRQLEKTAKTEGMADECAPESMMAMGAGQETYAAMESSKEEAPRDAGSGEADTDSVSEFSSLTSDDAAGEIAPFARVEVLELTEDGFVARILEMSYPFTEEVTVTAVLAEGLTAELTVGGEYTVYIESFDQETGILLVCGIG